MLTNLCVNSLSALDTTMRYGYGSAVMMNSHEDIVFDGSIIDSIDHRHKTDASFFPTITAIKLLHLSISNILTNLVSALEWANSPVVAAHQNQKNYAHD